MAVYSTLADIDFTPAELPAMSAPGRVVLAQPDHYSVDYVINAHMAQHVGNVNRRAAADQWHGLKRAFESLSIPVVVVRAVEGLPDFVFAANQVFPYVDPHSGQRGVVASRMRAPERREEVPHYTRFFREQGYEVRHLADRTLAFESSGDAVWHPRRHLIWGGYGHRTQVEAYDDLSSSLGAPVIALKLVDERFYHLDTCLSILDANTALVYSPALDEEGVKLIGHFFERVIETPEDEAFDLLACNALCPDGEHVLIQRGCTVTVQRLREAGYETVEVETGEFLKGGGSVSCLKQMIW